MILPSGVRVRFTHYNVKTKTAKLTYKYKCLLEQILDERPNIMLFMTPDMDKIKNAEAKVLAKNKKFVLLNYH